MLGIIVGIFLGSLAIGLFRLFWEIFGDFSTYQPNKVLCKNCELHYTKQKRKRGVDGKYRPSQTEVNHYCRSLPRMLPSENCRCILSGDSTRYEPMPESRVLKKRRRIFVLGRIATFFIFVVAIAFICRFCFSSLAPSQTKQSSASAYSSSNSSYDSNKPARTTTSTTTVNIHSRRYIILNTSTKCFHLTDECYAADRIDISNYKEVYDTVVNVANDGYSPCGICAKYIDLD